MAASLTIAKTSSNNARLKNYLVRDLRAVRGVRGVAHRWPAMSTSGKICLTIVFLALVAAILTLVLLGYESVAMELIGALLFGLILVCVL